jgi:hypothetical protein
MRSMRPSSTAIRSLPSINNIRRRPLEDLLKQLRIHCDRKPRHDVLPMHQEYTSREETSAISATGPSVCNQHDEHKLLIEGAKEVVGGGWIVCRDYRARSHRGPAFFRAAVVCTHAPKRNL